jgi:hypothetical protein
MQAHRVRLNDQEIDLIVAALTARLSGVSPATRQRIRRLAERLREGGPGNPSFRFGWSECHPGCALEKTGAEWRATNESLEQLPQR